jgi:WD40-like Beta Propeller Repeat
VEAMILVVDRSGNQTASGVVLVLEPRLLVVARLRILGKEKLMRIRTVAVVHFVAAITLLAVATPALAAPRVHPGAEGELIFVRPDGPYGPLTAHEIATRKAAFKLPAGMLSTDRSVFYSAVHEGDDTLVKAFDTIGGGEQNLLTVEGRWDLRGVSPNGKWLALIEAPSETELANRAADDEWTTNVQVIDADSGESTHELELSGHFEIDTISDNGTSLFLTQYMPANDPDHYLVRLYDLSMNWLQPDPLKDKRNQDEVMTGLAWNGLATPDGTYQLTLYLNTEQDMAFIHTLNLVERWPICIFLPSGQSEFEFLKGYQLTLSPDGRVVYASNAAMGLVAEVSLSTLEVTHVESFDPTQGAENIATTISADGKSLYFSAGEKIWSYDTVSKVITGTFEVPADVIALQVTNDGQALIAASDSTSSPLTAINPATGATDSYWGT